jgi:hypothetical protein
LLINAIKNFTKEKKASDGFGYEISDEFFDETRSEMSLISKSRRPSSGLSCTIK